MLDDDPTGTQLVADVDVVLDWRDGALKEQEGRPLVHVLTNSRALPPPEAYAVTRDAATTAAASLTRPLIALRGDSTLRGHLREEWEAVRDAIYPQSTPPLLLVPALPSAGRLTINGTHVLGGERSPVHSSPYARDAAFGYHSSFLPAWAEERSGGLFAASDAALVSLDELRTGGPDAVLSRLRQLARAARPAVCVVDAETENDIELSAEALRQSVNEQIEVIPRGSPALSAAFVPAAQRRREITTEPVSKLLVVCGSHVPLTTRQLAELVRRHPATLVELEIANLPADDKMISAVATSLRRHGLAVLATTREVDQSLSLTGGTRIAAKLAEIAGRVALGADMIVAKGGITSALVARDGLGARIARVEGSLAPGVALWCLDTGERLVVFPGNIGEDATLANLVDILMRA